jgi:hypothetical protein
VPKKLCVASATRPPKFNANFTLGLLELIRKAMAQGIDGKQELEAPALSERIKEYCKEVQSLIAQGVEYPQFEFKRSSSITRDNLGSTSSSFCRALPTHSRFTVVSFLTLSNSAFSSPLCNGLYPNLSQCVELRAQTAQSQPNVVYTYQWFRREPRRNHPS